MAAYRPTIEEFRELAKHGNLVPVYQEVDAALETRLSAYLKVADGPHSFLLESVEDGERMARYSFLGTDPYRVVRTGPGQPDGAVDPLPLVEAELGRFAFDPVEGLPRFLGGAVGYLAYDCAHYFEPRVPQPSVDAVGVPESVFMFTDTLLVFDHLRHRIQVVSHAHVDGDVDMAYAGATQRIDELLERLREPLETQRGAPTRPTRTTPPWSSARASASSRATSSRSCHPSESRAPPAHHPSTSIERCAG